MTAVIFVEKYNKHPPKSSIKRAVEQIYDYLLQNRLHYGVLSTYHNTWFIKVSDNKKLYISPPSNTTIPMLLQCLAYFILKVRENHTRGPSPPPNPLNRNRTNSNITNSTNSTNSTPKRKRKKTTRAF